MKLLAKLRSLWQIHFVLVFCICLNIGFWCGRFVWKWCVFNLSALNLKTVLRFFEKVFVFQKICFKIKVLNTFKTISQTEGYFENPYYRFLEEPMLFLLALKWNLWEKAFSSVKTKTNSNFAVKLAEMSNHSFLLPIW